MKNFHKITITLNLSDNVSYDQVFLIPTSKVSKQSASDFAIDAAQVLCSNQTTYRLSNIKIVEKSYKRIPKKFINILQD